MPNAVDPDRVGVDAIDHPIRPNDDLANVGTLEVGNQSAASREQRKVLGGL